MAVTTLNGMNWVSIWEELFEARSKIMQRDYEIEDWTKRAEDYSESRRTNQWDFGEKVYGILNHHGVVNPGSSILEVGSGPGTFVIPFARRSRHVTAVEPAEGMIKKIQQNAQEEGLSNYDILPRIWQDVDLNRIQKQYDLVIASTVVWMFKDIMTQIARMEEAAKGYCCVVGGVSSGGSFEGDLWKTIMGATPYPQYPEYPAIFNLLYQYGRVPQVRIIEYQSVRSFENMFNMYRIFYSIFTDVTPEIEETIKKALHEDSGDGPCVRNYRSSVVWWSPSERRNI
ncbi:class I SAM-dependent methyltransferase [Methanocalculus sp.]|uniref:class I SAM-dependent methyltransferase n=1 Tax=Methanocalculus sp. TaxID=2004547 RepID=UPI000A4E4C49|nr:class I SAM-dependent methyltransferase [Methanocalculus sp.]